MNGNEKKRIKLAILDLYDGVANEGMRCIREIIDHWQKHQGLEVEVIEFDVRQKIALPDLSFDIYVSSGGPGSPLDSEGSEWENKYFDWVQSVVDWNNPPGHFPKKPVFFICHSFQLACRYFNIAEVKDRKSTAFGVFPIHMIDDAENEPVFDGLPDPFYAVDSRDFQVVKPNYRQLRKMGATILAIEKERPHVPLERAVMSVRFNEWMIGTQFHPEADADGMTRYLLREDKKQTVISNHGEAKWQSMIEGLNDPGKIFLTNAQVLPNFLQHAVEQMQVTA